MTHMSVSQVFVVGDGVLNVAAGRKHLQEREPAEIYSVGSHASPLRWSDAREESRSEDWDKLDASTIEDDLSDAADSTEGAALIQRLDQETQQAFWREYVRAAGSFIDDLALLCAHESGKKVERRQLEGGVLYATGGEWGGKDTPQDDVLYAAEAVFPSVAQAMGAYGPAWWRIETMPVPRES